MSRLTTTEITKFDPIRVSRIGSFDVAKIKPLMVVISTDSGVFTLNKPKGEKVKKVHEYKFRGVIDVERIIRENPGVTRFGIITTQKRGAWYWVLAKTGSAQLAPAIGDFETGKTIIRLPEGWRARCHNTFEDMQTTLRAIAEKNTQKVTVQIYE